MLNAFRITLSGAEQVPPVMSLASGIGTAVYDSATTSLFYTITTTGLDWGPLLGLTPQTAGTGDDVIGEHFHSGARGANGAVVFDWFFSDTDDFRAVLNAAGTWTITGRWETTDPGSLIGTFAAALGGTAVGADAPLYANIHTNANTGGEIRGQLVGTATINENISVVITSSFGSECQLTSYTSNSVITSRTANAIRLHDAVDLVLGSELDLELLGTGFTYDMAGNVTGGTVTNILINPTLLGQVVATVSGLSVNAVSLYNAMVAHDTATLDALLFQAGSFNYAGDAGNDVFTGGSLDDTLLGGLGGDLLIGGGGSDTIRGEDGNDQLNGGAGVDQLFGGAGTDFLYFDNDVELGGIVDGGADYDYGFVQGGGTIVEMVSFNLENVLGGAGNDIIYAIGAAYDVVLNGAGGADQLTGGNGNDTFGFDAADTIVQGGAGTDFAWAITELAAVTVNMAAQGIEIAWGGAGGDTLNAAGVAVAVQIDGKDGNDIITGGSANNILIGNGGADSITGGAVGDQLFFDHLDTTVNGGGGFDYAFVHNALGVTVDLQAQQLEAVFGGFDDDVLDASRMASTAYLLGNTGADTLLGGAGDDIVWFDGQDPNINGGGGYNFAYAYNVGVQPVGINLTLQNFDTAWGGFGNDTLNAAGKLSGVVLVGLGGDDTMTGSDSVDTLSAGDGNDLINGNGGSDTIFGEGGTGDISVYDGVAGDYVIANVGLNVYTITHTATMAVDTLYNVEFARFTGTPGDVPLP